MVRELGDFCVGVAAFPDAHPERSDFDLDARVLVAKAQAGASFAITQLFFTADDYFALVARVRGLGCDIPIIPGIMPITNVRQVIRFAELSGAALPTSVTDRINEVADDQDRNRAVRGAVEPGRTRTAFFYTEPVPRYSRDLRQFASGAASSVTSRWVGRVSAT
jgi:methylenetetrahydrofolate reductase (NADPH)